MNTILYTIIVALVIAFVLGVLLGLFKKIFHVDVDPKVEKVRGVLSGANCGGCGLAGCDAFAGAVVKGDAPPDGCVAGGAACASQVAEILGKAGVEVKPLVAFIACNGSKDVARTKADYDGIKTCKAAELTLAGTKLCANGCIGFGDCVAECPFGALVLDDERGLPVVNYDLCVGCGKCVKTCPKKIITLRPKDLHGAIVRCSCKNEIKPQIKKDCARGCFKCGICAKKCPNGCIDLSTGLPVIDYSKCNSCKTCIESCPDSGFILFEELVQA